MRERGGAMTQEGRYIFLHNKSIMADLIGWWFLIHELNISFKFSLSGGYFIENTSQFCESK